MKFNIYLGKTQRRGLITIYTANNNKQLITASEAKYRTYINLIIIHPHKSSRLGITLSEIQYHQFELRDLTHG